MEMLRLNVRHELPQTGLRIRYGKIDRTKIQPSEIHTNLELGKSNQLLFPLRRQDSFCD